MKLLVPPFGGIGDISQVTSGEACFGVSNMIDLCRYQVLKFSIILHIIGRFKPGVIGCAAGEFDQGLLLKLRYVSVSNTIFSSLKICGGASLQRT